MLLRTKLLFFSVMEPNHNAPTFFHLEMSLLKGDLVWSQPPVLYYAIPQYYDQEYEPITVRVRIYSELARSVLANDIAPLSLLPLAEIWFAGFAQMIGQGIC